ncbi:MULTISPECIES: 4-(cytidine 5'-diphospho)-2-C-methyl-D-erythritol kinase [Pedobacter]|uniref:4-diphosphocytidyl-2-C-methyl-D-erythritol kinase n=1 Tax=Pedobacter heparinus (strain ATCC 13125 / DSM 2366 / CIP 104194 / JCM 7457 / NBRC 12017 / NCIMB 9290 / NRRL B-14731 / HIM 762-3) TaxID=485917 RepID=C6XT77_PEDHD|nr:MULTISPECIES: 4-(cytidine 5'-diphospho)-2-C-methyl-D-erythritol kinase [Pedobacter]ACU03638.1 4-diphosphocytidyl-2C-methyl-D-erythritol kinase [Pedobacter heparinus DSM 2366]MBB5436850.1 4-diphosphocytidyl-2-C-methyl-D-erythritol kinase [Pedobacter sp. AK017]
MLAFANAKINLGLNVTRKRPDGYHDIETVFYPVKLNDVVEITDSENTICLVKGIDVPGDTRDNLCLKAFNLLKKDFDLPAQQITLLKNIPVGAGLGGGSSDAAQLIRLVNDKFKLGLSVVKMQNYARELGADCAFFIENRPVYAFGKGDEFQPIAIDLSNYYVVLVKPPVHVSTAAAYAGIKPVIPSRSVKDLIHLPLKTWKQHLENDFESTVFSKYPEIELVKKKLYQSGALFALMSGSGASVFAIFEHEVSLPELENGNKVFYNI